MRSSYMDILKPNKLITRSYCFEVGFTAHFWLTFSKRNSKRMHCQTSQRYQNWLHDSHLFLPPGRYPSTPPPSCSGWRCSCRPRTGRPPAFSPVSLFVTSENPLSQFSILVGFQHKEPRVGPLDDDARPKRSCYIWSCLWLERPRNSWARATTRCNALARPRPRWKVEETVGSWLR